MTTDDFEAFTQKLAALADLYDAKLSESKLVLYFEALQDLDLDAVRKALGSVSKTETFFPKPAVIRKLVLGDFEDTAEAAWMACRKAMGQVGAYASLVTTDAALGEAILAVFTSWPAACTLELSPEMWSSKRKEFGRVYRVLASRQLSGARYLPGQCEQMNQGRADWMAYVPVAVLEGATVRTLSLEAAEEYRGQLAASAGFRRLGEGQQVQAAPAARDESA